MDYEWTKASAQNMGKRIASARERKGLNIESVAAELAVSRGTVGHWETGARAIKVEDFSRLCKLLEVNSDWLLFGVDPWPFRRIDYDSIRKLGPGDIEFLSGALVHAASQGGIPVKQRVA